MAKQLSVAALSIIHAVASGVAHGFDIIDHTKLPGGTVYPALSRMERDGFLKSGWEDAEIARADGRPPRRNYRVTRDGLRAMNEALSRVHALKPIRKGRV